MAGVRFPVIYQAIPPIISGDTNCKRRLRDMVSRSSLYKVRTSTPSGVQLNPSPTMMAPLPVRVGSVSTTNRLKTPTVISERLMAPDIVDVQGSTHGHDIIPVKAVTEYLTSRGYPESVISDIFGSIKPSSFPYSYIGSTKETGANRVVFGEAVNLVLDQLSKEEAAKRAMVIDSESYL